MNDLELQNFNSIKVRLKQLRIHYDDVYDEFQFHKGTIKTDVEAFNLDDKLFQFHKGTIKTEFRLSTSF